MKRELVTRIPTNYEYLCKKMRDEGVTQKELSNLMGKSDHYFGYMKNTKTGLTNDDIKVVQDLMDVDMKQLVLREDQKHADSPRDDGDVVISNLIKKIGELEARMARFEERLETPAIVTIPMNAKDMAILTMGELLEGGWTTKDDVLKAFNEKHIPVEYISDALKANNAISATSGVAERARTFYIAQ